MGLRRSAAAGASGERADSREPFARWLRLWGPRLSAAVVAAVYAAALVHEANVGFFPFEALPLQLALASPVVLLLALGTIALQQHVLLGGMTGR